MTTYPKPVYVGKFDPVRPGDIIDLYIDISADLATGEAISSVTFTTTDADGTPVAGMVGAHTETSSRTDFRVTAPATAGAYDISAEFTIDDGQQITHIAKIAVV